MLDLRCLRIICLASALSVVPAFSQRFAFQEYSQRDGLANLNVQTMVQDRAGMLWVGTQNGLYRYDGDRFQAVPLTGQDGVTYVTGLVFDGRGRLWISSTDSLLYLDQGGSHAVAAEGSFAFDVTNNLAADPDHPDQVFFISHHMLYQAEAAKGQAIIHRFAPAEASNNPLLNQVWSIATQPGGRIWLGCSNALCNLTSEGLRVFGPSDGLPNVPWTRIFIDRSGSLWTWNENHIARWNRAKKRFERADIGLPPGSIGIRNPNIVEDSTGALLMNLNMGLGRYRDGHWTIFRQEKDLPGFGIGGLLVDRQNSVWIAFSSHGLARWIGYDQWENLTAANGLGSAIIWNFLRDGHGDLWIGTEADLEKLDHATGKIEHQMIRGKSPVRRVQTLELAPNGHIWAGSDNGSVIDYDPRTHTSRTAAVLHGIIDLTSDGPDRMWISSMTGLYVLRRESNSVAHPPPPAPQGKCYQGVRADNGTLWFICDSGLYRLAGNAWTHIRLPEDYHAPFDAQLALAADGTLWLTGSPTPLFHVRIQGDAAIEVTRIPTSDTGTDNVFTVALDSRGWVWAGTDVGVAVYNGREWRRFTTDDGLVWNDTDSSAFLCDRDGTVWIGTSGGVSHVLHPERLFESNPLSLRVDDVHIGNTLLSPDRTLSVPLSSHSLSAHLTTLDFRSANHVVFRYKVEGLDDDWQESPRHDLRYPKLPAGRFTLVVLAVDTTTKRKSSPVRISFVVTPPWWKRTGAVTLEILAGLLALVAFWRWTMRLQVARQRRLEELVRDRTEQLEQEKAELVKARTALEVQARHDPLTGLLNHGAILTMLETEMHRALREDHPLGLVLMDLDHFKAVNDTYGHLAGDFVLQEYARRIFGVIREYDAAGRYGGEEILLVLPGLPQEAAFDRIKEIHNAVCGCAFDYGIESVRVTCSCGYSQFQPGDDDINSLVERADRALYAAKANGRNRIEISEGPGEPRSRLCNRA